MSNTPPPKTSFCHCFEHEGSWFVYDVATNNTYEINAVLAHVLPLWGDLSAEQVAERLQDKFDSGTVHEAIDQINKAREEHGMFRPCYPREILSPTARFDGFAPRVSQLILTVSEQCNLRCVYCVHGDGFPAVRSHSETHMSIETALAAVRFFEQFSPASAEIKRIGFFGGEALLCLDVIKAVVEYVKRSPLRGTVQYFVSTNGLLLNERTVIEYLCDNEVRINVSLDGPKDIHDRYRVHPGGHGSYDGIMRGLRRLLTHDPTAIGRLNFKCTMSPPYEYLRTANFFEHFPLFREMGFPEKARVSLAYVDSSELNHPAFDRSTPQLRERNTEETRDFYVDCCVNDNRSALPEGLRTLYDARLSLYHGRDPRPMPDSVVTAGCCSPISGEKVHVRADGKLTACEKMSDCAVIGDVFNGIDHDALTAMIADFHTSVKDRCRTCWALRLCKICYTVMNSTFAGSAQPHVPESVCEQTRRNTENTLKLFTSILARNPKALDFLADLDGPLR